MFYKIEVKDHIRVPPDLFNLEVNEAVLKRIKRKYEGFISKDIGIVIDITTDAEARDQELTSRIRALESKIQELQNRLSKSENEAATLRTRITELEADKVDENLKQL